MYRVLILVTVFLAATWADMDEEHKKCMRLFHPSSHQCCKGVPPVKPPPPEDGALQECMQLPGKEPSCDREICFASKIGFASSDGKINKAALQEIINSRFGDNAELSKAIIDNCVNGDISKYGKADMCDLMKMKICQDAQFALSCPEWDNNGPCTGIKDLVEECAEKFA